MQLQLAPLQFPHGVVRIVVPLPHTSERLAVEVLVALVWSVRLYVLRARYVRFEPCARRASEVALQSEHGPSVLPGDGSERHGAAYGVEVHHEQRIPFARLRLHDAALVDVGAGCSVGVDRTQSELCAVGHDASLHLCERSGMIAESLVGSDGDSLVWSPDALGA